MSQEVGTLSSNELFERARTLRDDDDLRWKMIAELHRRGERTILERCLQLIKGSAPERTLACDVLSQLGFRQRSTEGALPFRNETIGQLKACLSDSTDTVVASAVTALGHHGLDGVVDDVAKLAASSNVTVRFAVASALVGRTEPVALDALERLSRDPDPDVRDWATFTLGSNCDLDNTRVRRTLAARLDDADEDTRCEALVGLAVRKDPRGKEALKRMLMGESSYSPLMFEAAELYADPTLVPLLEKWRARFSERNPHRERGDGYLLRIVMNAIDACSRGSGPC